MLQIELTHSFCLVAPHSALHDDGSVINSIWILILFMD